MFCNNFYKLISRFPTVFKTIPTSYLDSLSYEDQLNWLCAVILELKDNGSGGGGTIPEGIEEDINNLKQAVAELQQTVQQLSNAISVQNESIVDLSRRVALLESYIIPGGAASMTESVLTEIQLPEVYTGTFVPAEL